MSFEQVRRVKAGGLEVAYREVGSGEPLLLIHGWPLSALTWRKVVPGLAATNRCIAIDLLGAGESLGDLRRNHGIAAQAELVAEFVDALGLEHANVIGHDSGGSVARSYAVAHPERVSRLVLADTEVPGHRPLLVVLLQAAARLPGSLAVFRATLSSKRLTQSRLAFGPAFADLGRVDFDELFETLIAPNVRSEQALRSTRRFLLDFDFDEVERIRSDYERLAMPKCLLWGEDDRIFPLEQGRRLEGMLPEPKRFVPIPGAGLLVHEERPEAWVDTVRSFLAGPDSA